MKLVHPHDMNDRQERALRLCFAGADIPISPGDVVRTMAAQASAMEGGLSVVSVHLPVPGGGVVDLLGTDAAGKPVLVFAGALLDVALISRACLCADWFARHRETIARLMPEVRWGGESRVWYAAARMSAEATALLTRFAHAPETYLYRGIELGGELWLVIGRSDAAEPAQSSAPSLLSVNAAAERGMGVRSQALSLQSILTDEEIDAFFEEEARAEPEREIASSARIGGLA